MSGDDSFEAIKLDIVSQLKVMRDIVAKASSMPHMTRDDLQSAHEAIDAINYGTASLFKSLDKLRVERAALAGDIAWAVRSITGGALVAASKATLSESALNAAAYMQAQEARLARQNSPQERALNEAITTVLNGRDPAIRGMSSRILNGVNRMLVDAGHSEVLRDVIARRLKKLRS